jgi:hypothetical protein
MQARRLPARRGVHWLMAGLALFRANPPMLSMMTMAYLLLVVLSLLHDLLSFLLPLLMPVLTVIVANGCRAIEKGGWRPDGNLVEGVREHRQALVQLGALQLLGSLLVVVLAYALGIGTALGDKPDPAQLMNTLLPLVGLSLPLVIAFWFAPLLAGWNGLSPIKSVFFSVVAVARNWRAFLAYALAIGFVGVVLPGLLITFARSVSPSFAHGVSTVLWMFLLFVLTPALMASVYVSYRDIFVNG